MTTAPSPGAIPRERQWRAAWIWPRDLREPNAHVCYRHDFRQDTVPQSADLFLSVESAARVWLNGHEVMRYEPSSYPGQHYYQRAAITAALRGGRNRLTVLARYIGIPSGGSTPKDPGLLAELVGSDGWQLGSSATWMRGPWTCTHWIGSIWPGIDSANAILDPR